VIVASNPPGVQAASGSNGIAIPMPHTPSVPVKPPRSSDLPCSTVPEEIIRPLPDA